jgi:hypothetical protein
MKHYCFSNRIYEGYNSISHNLIRKVMGKCGGKKGGKKTGKGGK